MARLTLAGTGSESLSGSFPRLEVEIPAPPGLGHLVNLAHLVQPLPTQRIAKSATLVADDVRVIASDWQIPGRLPVYGGDPRPVKRLQVSFTPKHFSASVEFASRDFIDPTPVFETPPSAAPASPLVIDSLPDDVPTGRILILATPLNDTTMISPPFDGHQIPSCATAFLWLPYATTSVDLNDMWLTASPASHFSTGPHPHYVTIYFTDDTDTGQSAPHDVAMWSVTDYETPGVPLWSYPYTVTMYP